MTILEKIDIFLKESVEIKPENLKSGTFIRLKKDSVPSLSYGSEEIPRKWVEDGGLWAIDGIPEYNEESDVWMLNINRVLDPYPGAFCSFITIDEIEEIIEKPKRRK